MFERFSEPARQAFVAAHAEARALGADRLGTGPILLGLLHDDASIAARAFSSLGISSREVRRRLVLAAPAEERGVPALELSDAAKRVLELSVREAIKRAGPRIGTGDLALAVLGVRDSTAARLLEELGVDRQTGRERVYDAMADGPEPAARRSSTPLLTTPQLTPEARQMLRTAARLGSTFAAGRFVSPNVMRVASATGRIARQLGPLGGNSARLAPAMCSVCGATSPQCGTLYTGPLGALVCERCADGSGAGGSGAGDRA